MNGFYSQAVGIPLGRLRGQLPSLVSPPNVVIATVPGRPALAAQGYIPKLPNSGVPYLTQNEQALAIYGARLAGWRLGL